VIGSAGLAFAQMLVLGVTFLVCGVAVGSHALRGAAGDGGQGDVEMTTAAAGFGAGDDVDGEVTATAGPDRSSRRHLRRTSVAGWCELGALPTLPGTLDARLPGTSRVCRFPLPTA